MKNKVQLFFLCTVFLFCVTGILSADEKASKTPVDYYFQKAEEARDAGDYERALEEVRKVLFVDQHHVRASYLLAELLVEKKEFKKAHKEFTFALESLETDERISLQEKNSLKENFMQQLKGLEQKINNENPFLRMRLNFYEINILVLSVFIIIALLWKGGAKIKSYCTYRKEMREERAIWLERYWEKRKEKTINRIFPALLGYFFCVFILSLGFFIIKKHGVHDCFEIFSFFSEKIFH
jgi:tetratricopeptide (TPR) repeat protein